MDNGVQVLTVTIQISDEGSESAFKIESHLSIVTFIGKADHNSTCHKCHFTEALNKRIEPVIDIFSEDLFIKFGSLLGASFVLYFSDRFDRALRHTTFIVLLP